MRSRNSESPLEDRGLGAREVGVLRATRVGVKALQAQIRGLAGGLERLLQLPFFETVAPGVATDLEEHVHRALEGDERLEAREIVHGRDDVLQSRHFRRLLR